MGKNNHQRSDGGGVYISLVVTVIPFYDVCVDERVAVDQCVRFLFSFPLSFASTFCPLRLPTEYERNGRYEGSR